MIKLDRFLSDSNKKSKLIMQVHDELVLDVPDEEIERIKQNLPRLMCEVAQLRVPLIAEVGVGPNWEQAH
jgi:DNA polymerase-1